MPNEKYLAKRKELMDQADSLIEEGKTDEANAKMDEVKDLDAKFEESQTAKANLAALNDKAPKMPDLSNKDKTLKVVEKVENKTTEEDPYVVAFAKTLMGQKLNSEESEVLASVNEKFRAETKTTATDAIVIPNTLQKTILRQAANLHPILTDVVDLFINGMITVVVDESSSGSGEGWIEESDESPEGESKEIEISLTGCELSRSKTVSWKLKKMSVSDYMVYVVEKLAEIIGDDLAYGIIQGKGKPGEGETFKPQARGIAAFIKSEQVVSYTTADPLSEAKIRGGIGKVKSGYDVVVYANNSTIWNDIAGLKDSTGKHYFVADATAGGVGRIFGKIVKEEAACPDGTIVLGDVKRGYVFNTIETMSITQEDHAKARTTDYVAYLIADGCIAQNKAFAVIKKQ
ncbi:MAG: phage major capsid protein [Candidatus Gastranaerophilales bacterium]|nr:phage major capsid protein [Candidatus Gastranaerophilales bacterium]